MRLESMPSRAASRNMLLLWVVAAVVLSVEAVRNPGHLPVVLIIVAATLAGARRHLLNWRHPRLAAHQTGED